MSDRTYVVLHEREGVWHPLITVAARNADEAIRAVAEQAAEPLNGFPVVAVPERHWRPKKVRTEQVTRISVEEAKST